MERAQAKKVVEALLYMTDHPLPEQEVVEVLDSRDWTLDSVKELIRELTTDYEQSGSPLRVMEVAGGVQVATRPEMADWVRRLYKERLTVKLSPSALETLSIIAYKQPIARGEIEQIRGVEASGVMETLLERRLVKVVGRKETIGRPLLYGTTSEFLRHFGLKHLSELPDLNSITPDLTPAEDAPILPMNGPDTAEGELPLDMSAAAEPGAADAAIAGESALPETESAAPETLDAPAEMPAAPPASEEDLLEVSAETSVEAPTAPAEDAAEAADETPDDVNAASAEPAEPAKEEDPNA
jgi:segregation and condensation protein B